MADKTNHNSTTMSEETAQNAGARTAETTHNPAISLEEARNAEEGKGPTGSGGPAPSTVEEHIPSSSDPQGTDLPSTT